MQSVEEQELKDARSKGGPVGRGPKKETFWRQHLHQPVHPYQLHPLAHFVDLIGYHLGPEGLPDPGPEVGEGGGGGPGQET